MACSGLLVGTISGRTFLPAFSGPLDDRGHQLLVVGVEIEPARAHLAAGNDHLGRHHHDVGRVRVALGEGLFEHEQVVRRADGDQLAIGFRQAQALGLDFGQRPAD